MMSIPNMVKVADIQRRYRHLVEAMKKDKKPIVVLNGSVPDAVVMDVESYDSLMQKMKYLEEEYLLATTDKAVKEFFLGKTTRLKNDQKLFDLIQ